MVHSVIQRAETYSYGNNELLAKYFPIISLYSFCLLKIDNFSGLTKKKFKICFNFKKVVNTYLIDNQNTPWKHVYYDFICPHHFIFIILEKLEEKFCAIPDMIYRVIQLWEPFVKLWSDLSEKV